MHLSFFFFKMHKYTFRFYTLLLLIGLKSVNLNPVYFILTNRLFAKKKGKKEKLNISVSVFACFTYLQYQSV